MVAADNRRGRHTVAFAAGDIGRECGWLAGGAEVLGMGAGDCIGWIGGACHGFEGNGAGGAVARVTGAGLADIAVAHARVEAARRASGVERAGR